MEARVAEGSTKHTHRRLAALGSGISPPAAYEHAIALKPPGGMELTDHDGAQNDKERILQDALIYCTLYTLKIFM